MKEVWLPVKGYEDKYIVSSLGNVLKLPMQYPTDGTYDRGCLLKITVGSVGYCTVTLFKNGTRVNKLVHRLVCESFVDNTSGLPQVNHKDGCKTNNNLNNLEWINGSDNQYHAIRNNLYQTARGNAKKSTKLTPNKVGHIRKLLADGVMQKQVAILYGVHQVTISDIKHKRSWSWVE